ncbi:MAG: AAA family ATPase [Bacillota bacterium]
MKKALIANVINPALGGVLIRGEKGTAKSTAVRALADLLPLMEVVEDCPFRCNPRERGTLCSTCLERLEKGETLKVTGRKMSVVDLPISATEDRVVGTLDLEHALKKGEKKFEPGILAAANRNILYVDEVNLLDDHLVDILLDAAAMGVNTVEREGVSYSHPASFVLVGTMNPEEGDLRPQLLDRFGLAVEIRGEYVVEQRMEIVKRRLAYEKDPRAFAAAYASGQQALADKIAAAGEMIHAVSYSEHIIELIAEIAIELGVDGHRADITMLKTAIVLAALDGRREVKGADVAEAAAFVLPHRMKRKPFAEAHLDLSLVQERVKAYDERGSC